MPDEIDEVIAAIGPQIEAAVSQAVASAIEEPAAPEPRREKKPLLTPEERRIGERFPVDASLAVYHQRQFVSICTPFGWVYQRDDGEVFDVLADAIRSVKPITPPGPTGPTD